MKALETFYSIAMDDIFKKAAHTPPHLFRANATYMLTASIYENVPVIRSDERKVQWRDAFLNSADIYHWRVITWVVLNNHYHATVESPDNPTSLSKFTGSYHKFTSRLWNDADQTPGRKTWWNYWDTCIRSEEDYCNRLYYVFWNPVKHGLAEKPEDYLFSNYRDFLSSQDGIDFSRVNEIKDVPEF